MPDWRVVIVSEDRRAERFLRRLCERQHVRVADTRTAPSGDGSAAEWVRQQFAGLVTWRRSRNYQQHLGLLVHLDGDNVGFAARKAELAERLADEALAALEPDEPVAVFAPTWSIETWLAHLAGVGTPPETARLKPSPDDPQWRPLVAHWKDEAAAAATTRAAVAGWRVIAHPPPSLADAYVQGARFGL
jgi:hypothetical protein